MAVSRHDIPRVRRVVEQLELDSFALIVSDGLVIHEGHRIVVATKYLVFLNIKQCYRTTEFAVVETVELDSDFLRITCLRTNEFSSVWIGPVLRLKRIRDIGESA